MMECLADILGPPVVLEELKHKPGRRRTLRARGGRSHAIVKIYASDRAAAVAARVDALSIGPVEPVLPELLHVDPRLHVVVLSEVPGRPLRESLLAGDLDACGRVGAALGSWHSAWLGSAPVGLAPHSAGRELRILLERAGSARPGIAAAVRAAVPEALEGWECRTVVHRDLYEEQVLVGERIGLIDIDDAALGPPELDVGNLVAHMEWLERTAGADLTAGAGAILDGYARTGPALDGQLLDRCRSLSLLRLACLHAEPSLVDAAMASRARI
jgi:Ser/Thr protein kinase RdoA (MazF antagonist)